MSTNQNILIVLGTVAANTCTYTSGNWDVNCADFCNITSNVVGDGSNLILYGTGTFSLKANITDFKEAIKDNNCLVIKEFPNYIQIG